MPAGRFELREIEWTPARGGVAALMLVVATLYLALATTTERLRFAVFGLGLLVWFVVFFTDLWQPVYNLYGAVYVVVMSGVWFLGRRPLATVVYADVLVETALVVLFVYLFVTERRGIDPETPET